MMKNGDYFIIIICDSTLGCCVIQYLDLCKLDDLRHYNRHKVL